MNEIFFRPEQAWVGDCMPCYHDGSYYMYYQCDRREPKPFPNGEPFGWSLAVSVCDTCPGKIQGVLYGRMQILSEPPGYASERGFDAGRKR